ncbi:hypothetical protein ACH4TY_26955 [Streptomyces anulatus]
MASFAGKTIAMGRSRAVACDLYLTCAKFVTTPEYAPRLRARREVEQALALDAAQRGWDREVERHRCTSDRIDKLLADLGQPAHPKRKPKTPARDRYLGVTGPALAHRRAPWAETRTHQLPPDRKRC